MMLLFIFQTGCKKNDLIVPDKNGESVDIRSFFSESKAMPDQVVRVMDELKIRNENSRLVGDISKKYGTALWEKSMIKIPVIERGGTSTIFKNQKGRNDTLVIIPLLKNRSNQVFSYIEAHLTDKVEFKIRTAKEYSRKSFGKAVNKVGEAERHAFRLMLINKEVFGYESFKILDKRLFHGSENYNDTANINYRINLKDKDRSVSLYRYVEVCFDVITYDCKWKEAECSEGCDLCSECIKSVETKCIDGWYDDEGGGGSGESGNPGIPGDSGGNGGEDGGDNGGNPDPCDGGGLIIYKLPPCDDGGGDPGWVPTLPEAPDPINLTIDLNLNNGQSAWLATQPDRAIQIVKYLEKTTVNNKNTIAVEHINRMMNDAEYLAFVENHALSGNQNKMWWEDETWLESYGGGPDYGNWAINYLVQNTSTSFSLFQNQFMSMPEGSDGGDVFNLADYDNVQVPTFTKLPGRNDLYNAFPKAGTVGMESKDVYELVGGNMHIQNIADNQNYRNACAIRVSRALNYSSYNNTFHAIPVFKNKDGDQKSEKGDDGKNYILDAASLLAYMLKAYPNNPPLHLKNKSSEEYLNALNGKWGIYIMVPKPGTNFRASGHADFFSQTGCLTISCYFQSAKEIYFWELF